MFLFSVIFLYIYRLLLFQFNPIEWNYLEFFESKNKKPTKIIFLFFVLFSKIPFRKSGRAILRYQCCCELAEIHYTHSVGVPFKDTYIHTCIFNILGKTTNLVTKKHKCVHTDTLQYLKKMYENALSFSYNR